MRFKIDDLPIYFPYDYIYPEQFQYMKDIKSSLDAKGHCLLEMPSGTGKTISLLSLIVAYQMYYPEKRKLIYSSRTVPEIEKALAELQRLIKYRLDQGLKETFLGLGLSSRKNLCVHSSVSKEKRGEVVDAKCKALTAPWVRKEIQETDAVMDEETNQEIPDIESLCAYYETLQASDPNEMMPSGVYTLADLKEYGKKTRQCPYFLARKMIPYANVVIYSYHYLLDPKVAAFVSKELAKNCIVVFDEAHNIDNVCVESLSIDLTRSILDAGSRSVTALGQKIDE
jgi:DNA excision repair protein ERCC-2